MRRRTGKYYIGASSRYIILLLFTIWTIVPIFIVITNSFKTEMDIFTLPFKLFFSPTLDNYTRAFTTGEFDRFFLNSLIVAFSSSLLSVGLGVLAAYGFTNFRLKFGRLFNVVLVVGKSVPAITILLP